MNDHSTMKLYLRGTRVIHANDSTIQSCITIPVSVKTNQELFDKALDFGRSILEAKFFLDQHPLRDVDLDQSILESINND